MTLLHQPQSLWCRHLSPVKDIEIFLEGTRTLFPSTAFYSEEHVPSHSWFQQWNSQHLRALKIWLAALAATINKCVTSLRNPLSSVVKVKYIGSIFGCPITMIIALKPLLGKVLALFCRLLIHPPTPKICACWPAGGWNRHLDRLSSHSKWSTTRPVGIPVCWAKQDFGLFLIAKRRIRVSGRSSGKETLTRHTLGFG